MSSLKYWTICGLLVCLSVHVNADCGCNKLKRETKEEAPSDKSVDNLVEETKSEPTCSGPSASLKDLIQHESIDPDSVDDMVLIPSGTYFMGTDKPVFKDDRESPERPVNIDEFYLDKFEVSNAKFQQFVDATTYVTEAEKFGDSFVFKGQIDERVQEEYKDYRVANAVWWYKVRNVDWKHPEGEASDISQRLNHPVVHVSWADASNFCKWQGKRLPSEEEWEAACRGGKKGKLFPWGNKLNAKDQHWVNIWQGTFPDENTADDGHAFTSPVDTFEQNTNGLCNMVGNVWEWTSTLWDPTYANEAPEKRERVKKGGSFLCHQSYCYRYRCAARSQNTEDSSASNLGFRCARSVQIN